MVDLAEISDSSLRDLLLKFDKDAPPVNATTRKVLEKKVKEHYGGSLNNVSNGSQGFSPNKSDYERIVTPSGHGFSPNKSDYERIITPSGYGFSPNKSDYERVITPSDYGFRIPSKGDGERIRTPSPTKPPIQQRRVSPPSESPRIARYIEKPSEIIYDYEREPISSTYSRKSLNAYRDNSWADNSTDSTARYNVIDRPGYTPFNTKTVTKPSLSKEVINNGQRNNNKVKGALLLALIGVLVVIGIYFLLHWDPSYENPISD